MRCPGCGSNVQDGSKFCNSCGARMLATAELGDLLFSVVNLARHLDVDPEIALSRANATFIERFRVVEQLAEGERQRLRDYDLPGLDRLWEIAKTVVSTEESGSSFTLPPERNGS